jgi:hypothetical protein
VSGKAVLTFKQVAVQQEILIGGGQYICTKRECEQ